MADPGAGAEASAGTADHGNGAVGKIIVALVTVLVGQALLTLCLVSAGQLLVLRSAPFGTVGASQVVAQTQSTTSLDIIAFPNESAAMDAVNQGRLYGVYVTGGSSDTLIVVPSKSFFAQTEVESAFLDAAHKLNRPVTVKTVKPLPDSDRVGAVVTFLLLPLLIGGYLASVLVFKASGGKAAAPWRPLILTGYAVVGAFLTDLIAGTWIGAYSNNHFWTLLPCFALVTAAVVLAAAAIQGLVGSKGTLVVALLFIVFGGVASGGSGTSLLPTYWRNIGVIFPPQNAVSLIRNVLYFDGNNITTPLIVLFLWGLAGAAVIVYLGRIRPARAAAHGHAETSGTGDADTQSRRSTVLPMTVALGICAIMQCLFAFNYMDSGHAPVATDLPFGVVGSSPLVTEAGKQISLKVTVYHDESAVKTAIDQAKIWGALIPGTSDKPNTLIVVPTSSGLAPLDLEVQFEKAAKQVGQQLTVQQYAPVPLPKKDPFGLVLSLMLVPLLIGGYISATLLLAATGKAAARWRLAQLAGFAIVAGLAVDLVVGVWLQGYASDKFWITWPICSLIIAAVACVAAVLQKLLGSIGTLVTVVVIILFGNPSSGGANGALYLPTFWRDIGPYLPPRNAYILLHQTIYFSGHGTTQSLLILLGYLVVAAIILGILDVRGSEGVVPTEAAEAAALAIPIAT